MPRTDPTSQPTQRTSALVVLLILTAIIVRGLFVDRIAVEHFDEGVYASNLLVGEDYNFAYPSRHLYAPPLLPWLIEWMQVAWGIGDFSAVVVNLVAGVLTVWLVWWTGRCWFGNGAGIAAATLAALSGMHILYSRTALTDPLLCFGLLAAVHAVWMSLRDGDKTWAVLAGILTGLCWWTKYNGWLPIAIGVAGAIPWLIFSAGRRRLRSTALCLLIIAGTAVLIWLPVLWSLPDGYASVAANHSRYVVGLARWPETLWRQLLNHRRLEGAFGCLSLAAALIAASVAFRGTSRRGGLPPIILATAAGLTALAVISTSSIVLAAIGAYWLFRSLKLNRKADPSTPDSPTSDSPTSDSPTSDSPTPDSPTPEESDRQLALWLLAAWIGGLTVATPLYTPFPRLTLPWLVALWLIGGAGLDWLVSGLGVRSRDEDRSRSRATWGIFLAAVVVSGAGLGWRPGDLVPAWQPRTGLADVAERVNRDIRHILVERGMSPDTDVVIDVYGEPSLYFQLRKLGIALALPASNLRFAQPDAPPPRYPTFLLIGPHNQQTARFLKQYQTASPRLKLAGIYEYAPSDLVLLNKFPPSQLTDATGRRRRDSVRLYDVR